MNVCDHPPKVAVIGAGISGLGAAASLIKKGFDVHLLEASDYIGGRLKQVEPFPGFPPVDLGADFIHGSNNILHQIAKENGWKVKDAGELYIYIDGKLYSMDDLASHPDLHSVHDAWNDIQEYGHKDQNESSVVKYRNQDSITGVSLQTWLYEKGYSQKTVDIMESIHAQKYASTLKNIGVLELAVWQNLRTKMYGTGDFRLEGSYSILLSHFINKCKNVDKRLNWPVKEIKWKDNPTGIHPNTKSPVNIKSQHGETLQVDYAVITVPLTILKDGDISFLPELPATKQHAIQSIYMGAALKVVCRFKNRFWQKIKLILLNPNSFLQQVWMYSRDPKPDGEECHVVVGFETAAAAAQKVHLSGEEVCQRFIQQLDKIFGSDKDPKPASRNLINFVYYHWSKHPYIRGGYSCPTVNTHGLLEKLAEPVEGKLFFAGEATQITSTVHSALEAGIRAAEEVCKADGGSVKSQL